MTKKDTCEKPDLSAWMREAMAEVSRDVNEINSGRSGFMHTYTAEELLKELHS